MTSPSEIAAALGERYQLSGQLGAGGMATVYRALNLKHGRAVAIKVLHPKLQRALGPARFLRTSSRFHLRLPSPDN